MVDLVGKSWAAAEVVDLVGKSSPWTAVEVVDLVEGKSSPCKAAAVMVDLVGGKSAHTKAPVRISASCSSLTPVDH